VQPVFTTCLLIFAGIPPHVDTHSAFEDPVLSLSLGSSIVMEFRHQDGRAIPVLLPRRSLLIMSEEARYCIVLCYILGTFCSACSIYTYMLSNYLAIEPEGPASLT
jgi:hypothetical protein